jgi:hypothetical protein
MGDSVSAGGLRSAKGGPVERGEQEVVRRKSIRTRMRGKLRKVKQQLRMRMHDPLSQTGRWLQSVVQGHFNYYAVPGNLASLGAFRDRVLAL